MKPIPLCSPQATFENDKLKFDKFPLGSWLNERFLERRERTYQSETAQHFISLETLLVDITATSHLGCHQYHRRDNRKVVAAAMGIALTCLKPPTPISILCKTQKSDKLAVAGWKVGWGEFIGKAYDYKLFNDEEKSESEFIMML